MSETKRTPIGKKLRFDVFKRDGFVCQYCGSAPPEAILHVDHIQPVKEGGKNNIDNLVTACDCCNLGKGATPLAVVPKSLQEKAAEVAEREAQLRGYNKILQAKADRIEAEAWVVAEALEQNPDLQSYSKARLRSIKVFLGRMPVWLIVEAAEISRARFRRMNEGAFRYFCGVCWTKIREAENG